MSRSKKEKNMTKLRGDVPKKIMVFGKHSVKPREGGGVSPLAEQSAKTVTFWTSPPLIASVEPSES